MKVILKEADLKEALSDYLLKNRIDRPIKNILLRRRSNNTEEVGSVMIELISPVKGK